MLSDVGVQDVRECGSNVERDRVGEQNQKRTVRHIGDHQPRGHDPAGMGSSACRVERSGNRLGLPSLEKMHQNPFWSLAASQGSNLRTLLAVNGDRTTRTRRVFQALEALFPVVLAPR